ncbi:hypothetical protein GCM10010245_86650 [Streptomyces spectabilis]|nr:hypothetical protein GCM10010245_86650 [Streptomyces spectabilis]
MRFPVEQPLAQNASRAPQPMRTTSAATGGGGPPHSEFQQAERAGSEGARCAQNAPVHFLLSVSHFSLETSRMTTAPERTGWMEIYHPTAEEALSSECYAKTTRSGIRLAHNSDFPGKNLKPYLARGM